GGESPRGTTRETRHNAIYNHDRLIDVPHPSAVAGGSVGPSARLVASSADPLLPSAVGIHRKHCSPFGPVSTCSRDRTSRRGVSPPVRLWHHRIAVIEP